MNAAAQTCSAHVIMFKQKLQYEHIQSCAQGRADDHAHIIIAHWRQVADFVPVISNVMQT